MYIRPDFAGLPATHPNERFHDDHIIVAVILVEVHKQYVVVSAVRCPLILFFCPPPASNARGEWVVSNGAAGYFGAAEPVCLAQGLVFGCPRTAKENAALRTAMVQVRHCERHHYTYEHHFLRTRTVGLTPLRKNPYEY